MRTPSAPYAAALCLIALAGCATDHAQHEQQPPQRSRVQTLLTQPLPDRVGTEGRVLTVEIPPGAASPPHHHDGAVFAYVLDGTVVTALDDGPEQTFEAGRAWYEHPGQIHRVSRNPSPTKPAKLLVYFLTNPGHPVLQFEK
jgi:quercetin dioxygenase-like cupin family protein